MTYGIISYKKQIEGKIGVLKKLGYLCSEHFRLNKEELNKLLKPDYKDIKKINLLTPKKRKAL